MVVRVSGWSSPRTRRRIDSDCVAMPGRRRKHRSAIRERDLASILLNPLAIQNHGIAPFVDGFEVLTKFLLDVFAGTVRFEGLEVVVPQRLRQLSELQKTHIPQVTTLPPALRDTLPDRASRAITTRSISMRRRLPIERKI